MDTNNILKILKKYKERKIQERNQLIDQIHSIQPDIYDLIKIANEAEDAGISLQNYKRPHYTEKQLKKIMHNKVIDEREFMYNTMVFIRSLSSSHIIVGIGFACGGGKAFFINGKSVCVKNSITGEEIEAPTDAIKTFLNMFLNFRKDFLDYIKKEISYENLQG